MLENSLVNFIENNYGMNIVHITNLSGGWKNKKYVLSDNRNNQFVFKIFSTDKVEKMSNGEFSFDYLETQMRNNLKIESFMHNLGLNCPQIIPTINGDFLPNESNQYATLMSFIDGINISRDDITLKQLFNLGLESAKMHLMFQNIDSTVYDNGRYLKIPTIDELFENLNRKCKDLSENSPTIFINLLKIQRSILNELKTKDVMSEIPITLTHGDLANDNVLFCGDIPYIVDFELVRKNSYLLDIGRILMSYCFENNGLNFDRLMAFYNGYKSINYISENDVMLSFITVWLNEVDMWIKEKYFNKKITDKAQRFQDELIYLTCNFFNILDSYHLRKKDVFIDYLNREECEYRRKLAK